MKNKFILTTIPLLCLTFTSCDSRNNDSESSGSEEFTYFTGKTFASLKELESELINNWFITDGIYKGYYGIKKEFDYNNFGSNSSIRNLLSSAGKQFVYDMNVTRHLCERDVVRLLDYADAFVSNKYAICNHNNKEESFGAPIYFGNLFWGYDNWEVGFTTDYSWKNYDVGKRILSDLSFYVSSDDYEVSGISVYVTKNTYSLDTYTFTGKAYVYARVLKLSTNRYTYQKYSMNLETKRVSRMTAVDREYSDAENNNLFQVY